MARTVAGEADNHFARAFLGLWGHCDLAPLLEKIASARRFYLIHEEECSFSLPNNKGCSGIRPTLDDFVKIDGEIFR